MTRCVLLVAALLAYPIAAAAAGPGDAEPGSSWRGRVVDALRAPIAGARVVATAPGRPAVLAVTDRAGEFALTLLAGKYAVRVAGAQVGQVPHHMLSLWNSCQVHPRVAAGLGVLYRSDMFAAIDNTVTLPGYTRADAAAYFHLSTQLRLQANVENLFDTKYYVNADGNTNISPGFTRTLRVALTATF